MIHIVFVVGIAVTVVTVGVTLWLVIAQRPRSRRTPRDVFSNSSGVAETIMTSDD